MHQLLYQSCDVIRPSLHAVEAFPHHDTVTSNDDHADLILLCGRHNLNRVVEHNVHELVISTQNPHDVPVRVQLQVQALLHKLSQISSCACLGHHWCEALMCSVVTQEK